VGAHPRQPARGPAARGLGAGRPPAAQPGFARASLQADPALREALNQHLLEGAQRLTGRLREGVTTHIAQTVKGWDERHLVEQLELSVGRDLQFIRFNGTLVGGLIGLLLHAATVVFRF
jgi:uncharacterized membrane-anchored protein YjiN (DUF445 family)